MELNEYEGFEGYSKNPKMQSIYGKRYPFPMLATELFTLIIALCMWQYEKI